MSACWLNGNLVDDSMAVVSVFDHGLLYGDGVFEGLRFYHGRCFMLAAHLERLQQSARALALTIPYDLPTLSRAIADTISASGLQHGYLRLVITRGPGSLGVDPANCPQPTVFIIADHLQLVSDALRRQGLRIAIVNTRRVPDSCWDSRIKSLNYLNNVLARQQARAAGADEGIMLNQQGHVSEGSVNNIFIVSNNALLTPAAADGALEGITRSVILELAAAAGITISVRSLTAYDLYTADECFLSGTGVELLPVRQIDNHSLGTCPGAVFQSLETAFRNYVDRHCQQTPAELAS